MTVHSSVQNAMVINFIFSGRCWISIFHAVSDQWLDWPRRYKSIFSNFTVLFFSEIPDNIEILFYEKEVNKIYPLQKNNISLEISHWIFIQKNKHLLNLAIHIGVWEYVTFHKPQRQNRHYYKKASCSVSVGCRCSRFIASLEWLVLTFLLKNINIKSGGLAVASAF